MPLLFQGLKVFLTAGTALADSSNIASGLRARRALIVVMSYLGEIPMSVCLDAPGITNLEK